MTRTPRLSAATDADSRPVLAQIDAAASAGP
jgi:hypothetical protein